MTHRHASRSRRPVAPAAAAVPGEPFRDDESDHTVGQRWRTP